jgi:hypothetical protein
VGSASSLLSRRRSAALIAVVVALVAWDAGAGVLPDVGRWPDVLVVAVLLLPLTLTIPLLALPLATAQTRAVVACAAVLAATAVLLSLLGVGSLFNVTKVLALTAIGFVFMQVFEALSWIVLIALIIPWVDAISVWRGPTDYVVSEQPSLFDRISVAFRLPGESGSANLGPPDVLFFALFLGTAARFGLRVGWTWVSMTALLSLTLVLTNVTDVAGLPALPAIAIGFLLPNLDLIWRAWRERGLEVRRESGR